MGLGREVEQGDPNPPRSRPRRVRPLKARQEGEEGGALIRRNTRSAPSAILILPLGV
jgi:hypothetical protein